MMGAMEVDGQAMTPIEQAVWAAVYAKYAPDEGADTFPDLSERDARNARRRADNAVRWLRRVPPA